MVNIRRLYRNIRLCVIGLAHGHFDLQLLGRAGIEPTTLGLHDDPLTPLSYSLPSWLVCRFKGSVWKRTSLIFSDCQSRRKRLINEFNYFSSNIINMLCSYFFLFSRLLHLFPVSFPTHGEDGGAPGELRLLRQEGYRKRLFGFLQPLRIQGWECVGYRRSLSWSNLNSTNGERKTGGDATKPLA